MLWDPRAIHLLKTDLLCSGCASATCDLRLGLCGAHYISHLKKPGLAGESCWGVLLGRPHQKPYTIETVHSYTLPM